MPSSSRIYCFRYTTRLLQFINSLGFIAVFAAAGYGVGALAALRATPAGAPVWLVPLCGAVLGATLGLAVALTVGRFDMGGSYRFDGWQFDSLLHVLNAGPQAWSRKAIEEQLQKELNRTYPEAFFQPADLANFIGAFLPRGCKLTLRKVEAIAAWAEASSLSSLSGFRHTLIDKLTSLGADKAVAVEWAEAFMRVHVIPDFGETVPTLAQIAAALRYALPLGPEDVGTRRVVHAAPPTPPAGGEGQDHGGGDEGGGSGPLEALATVQAMPTERQDPAIPPVQAVA
jgi:hypothetical protein